jgi:hypothetical protein
VSPSGKQSEAARQRGPTGKFPSLITWTLKISCDMFLGVMRRDPKRNRIQIVSGVLLLVGLVWGNGCARFLFRQQTDLEAGVKLSGDHVRQTTIALRLPPGRRWEEFPPGRERLDEGHITVFYPRDREAAARALAADLDRIGCVVAQRTGVVWSPHLFLVLVDTDTPPGSLHIEASSRGREFVCPILIAQGKESLVEIGKSSVFYPGMLAHEITEHSLASPREGAPPFLCDLRVMGFSVRYGTRWFRDGCAEYARITADEVSKVYPPGDRVEGVRAVGLSALDRVGTDLLDWGNDAGERWRGHAEGDLYAAALGLICRMRDDFGPDVLPRIMAETRRYRWITGRELAECVQRVTGLSPRTLITSRRFPWLGIVWRVQWTAGHRQWFVDEVQANSPAAGAGVFSGDRLVRFDRREVGEWGEMLEVLAQKQPGDPVELRLQRDGKEVIVVSPTGLRPPGLADHRPKKRTKLQDEAVRVRSLNYSTMSVTTSN